MDATDPSSTAPVTPAPFSPARATPDAQAWADAMNALDLAAAQRIKHDTTTTVYFAELRGQPVVLKRWALSTRADRLKALFGASRADRHLCGSRTLTRLGIHTAPCLAILDRGAGPTRERWLIMQRLSGRTLLQHLAARDLSARTQHALARELAHHFISLRNGGLVNRDPKPSNLIVTCADRHAPAIAMIDCVAIRRGSRAAWLRSMALLYIEPLGCNVPPRRALVARFVATIEDGGKADRLALWRHLAQLVRDHGDPKPRVNPLA